MDVVDFAMLLSSSNHVHLVVIKHSLVKIPWLRIILRLRNGKFFELIFSQIVQYDVIFLFLIRPSKYHHGVLITQHRCMAIPSIFLLEISTVPLFGGQVKFSDEAERAYAVDTTEEEELATQLDASVLVAGLWLQVLLGLDLELIPSVKDYVILVDIFVVLKTVCPTKKIQRVPKRI